MDLGAQPTNSLILEYFSTFLTESSMSSLSPPSLAYLSPSHAKSLKCKCASLYNGRPRGSKGWLRHTRGHACMTSTYPPFQIHKSHDNSLSKL